MKKSSNKKNKIKIKTSEVSKLTTEKDMAFDFATKAYKKFEKIIKSIVLFGSSAKENATKSSDIDIIIILDDCTIQWDEELVAWYREELGKIIKANPYRKSLHINTVRLSTWWNEMLRGEPIVINVIRYGEALIDFGGFFNPLKVLLAQGKIKNTPEMIYITLGRAPSHMARSKAAILSSMEGLYWAFVDSAHAALIAAKQIPPSPEQIPEMLTKQFISKRMLNSKYAQWYREIYELAHRIFRNEITEIKGKEIDEWRERSDLFVREMARVIRKIT